MEEIIINKVYNSFFNECSYEFSEEIIEQFKSKVKIIDVCNFYANKEITEINFKSKPEEVKLDYWRNIRHAFSTSKGNEILDDVLKEKDYIKIHPKDTDMLLRYILMLAQAKENGFRKDGNNTPVICLVENSCLKDKDLFKRISLQSSGLGLWICLFSRDLQQFVNSNMSIEGCPYYFDKDMMIREPLYQ